MTVTPTTAGTVTLTATYGSLVQTITFLAYTRPDTLQIVSAPTGSLPTGVLAANPFTVRLLAGDGTADAGKAIAFSASGAQLGGCSGACAVPTEADGSASVSITPSSAGTVTLTATYGSLVQTVTFTAYTRPDTLQLVSAPSGTVPAGVLATTAFAVKLLAGDGTGDQGRAILFTASGAQFSGCGAQPCTAVTAADGSASLTLTPATAGTVTLTATYGSLTQTVAFTAYTRPDTLQLVSAPSGTLPTGVLARTAFSVRLLGGDGTADTGKSILFTASGAQFAVCSTQPCAVSTGTDGGASLMLTPTTAGTVTLSATYGSLTQTVTFTAYTRPDTLQLVSAPSGTVPAGVLAAVAFTVKLLAGDGTADAGKEITFSATNAQFSGCNTQPCAVTTAGDGTAGLSLTPAADGNVTLTASYGSLTQTVAFVAAARPDTMRLVSAPAGTLPTGVQVAMPFAVQVLLADGTADAGRPVVFTAAGAQLSGCTGQPCTAITAGDGTASVAVTPKAAGPVTLTATYGSLSETASFTAYTRPDTLTLLSAPASGGYVGATAAVPFAVQVFAGDGTAAPGHSVTLSVAGGAATFAACAGASSCTLAADASGVVSTMVTPGAAGSITLLATDAQASVFATFSAVANQYSLTALNPAIYLAEGAVAEVIVGVTAQQNGLATALQPVHWTGSKAFQPASGDTVTGSTGQSIQSATVGPLAAGAQGSATACAWSGTCATFMVQGVSADALQPAISVGAAQVASSLGPVTVTVTDLAGHPVAGAPVSLYQTVTAYPGPCPAQGRCPAAAVLASLVTVAVSDANGRYTFAPLTVGGLATQTEIAVAAGTQGFTTTTLMRQP